MSITFPADPPSVDTTAVASVGGTEKYNTLDGAYVSVLNIGSASITSLAASKITTGSLASDVILTSSLSASQITTGTMVADRISGGSLLIGGSADALGVIVIKNSSATEITKMNNSGIIVRNTRGLFFESTAAGDYFSLSNNASSQAILRMPNSDQLLIVDSAGTTNLFTVSSTKVFSEKEFWINNSLKFGNGTTLGEHNIEGIDILKGYNDLRFQISDTSKFSFLDKDGNEVANVEDNGDINKLGSVSFRIPHPEDAKRDIHYPAVEAPETALKIRGVARLKDGAVKVELPHHWELVTERDGLTTVQVTPLEDCFGLFVPEATTKNTSFVVKELMDGDSNAHFAWEVTAVRKGYLNFNPEPLHTDQNGFKLTEDVE